MQQNPPPFKRFARERFDGTSLQGQRPAIVSTKSYSSSSRNPIQHSQHQIQAPSRPSSENRHNVEPTTASLPFVGPQYTYDGSRTLNQQQDSYKVSPVTDDAPYPWRLQASAIEPRPRKPTVNQRRQHAALWTEHDNHSLQPSASPAQLLLHPQLRPHSDVNDYGPRSISQPNTPSFYPYTQHQDLEGSPPSGVNRSESVQPEASSRRRRSATVTGEASFTDEEFHLFVQATAGLGPDQSHRNSNLLYDASDDENYDARTEHMLQTASTTLHSGQDIPAMDWTAEQPAAMPYGRPGSQQQDFAVSRPPMQRLETSSSALDLWLQPPSAAPEDEYTVSPIEDELPDYATSQAQAQAEQRTEAARRAKELRRRWEESRR